MAQKQTAQAANKKNKKIVKPIGLPGAERTDKGVVMKGIVMQPIVEKCEGCERAAEFDGEKFCPTYAMPATKWANGVCNFATHVRATVDKEGKVKVNPLKASKRAARSR